MLGLEEYRNDKSMAAANCYQPETACTYNFALVALLNDKIGAVNFHAIFSQ